MAGQKAAARYAVVLRVLDGGLSVAEAARLIGCSERHVKRLKSKYREGLKAFLHGNRGREPANKLPREAAHRVLELAMGKYKGFNDTHLTEKLREVEGLDLSRETVRKLLRSAKVAPQRKRRPPRHHSRREPMPARGMMVQWDGSPHRWFGPEHAACCLIAAVDDADSTLLGALFVGNECSWGYLSVLKQMVAAHGIPLAIYHDKHSSLHRNDPFWSLEEELAERREPTQVGLALEALGIGDIVAHSPQAKGRVEKRFDTLQDRLVSELRLAGITDIEEANSFLQKTFIPDFNQKFGKPPACKQAAFRRARPLDLERICSFRYTATVGNDNCVRLSGLTFDIPPGPHRRSYAGCRVEVRQLLDGSWRIYSQDSLIATSPPTDVSEPIRARRRRKDLKAAFECEWIHQREQKAAALDATSPATRPTLSIRKAKGNAIAASKVA